MSQELTPAETVMLSNEIREIPSLDAKTLLRNYRVAVKQAKSDPLFAAMVKPYEAEMLSRISSED